MDYATGTARLVEPGNLAGRGVAAVLDRSEIEDALRSKEWAELILDVTRQGDVEAHTLGVRWDPPDLEQVLRTTEGERIAIAFDQRGALGRTRRRRRRGARLATEGARAERRGCHRDGRSGQRARDGRRWELELQPAARRCRRWCRRFRGSIPRGGDRRCRLDSRSADRWCGRRVGRSVPSGDDRRCRLDSRSADRWCGRRVGRSVPAETIGAAISTADQPIGGAVAASGDQSPAETTGAAISTADQPIGGAVAASGDQSPAEVTGGAGPTPHVAAPADAPAFVAPGDGLTGAEAAGLAGLGGIAITAAAFAAASQRRRRVEPA